MRSVKLFAVVILLLGCLSSVKAARQINPGDLVTVQVAGEADISRVYQVDETGSLDFPQMGKVAVAGKTQEQAQKLVLEFLSQFYKDPEVRLELAKSKGNLVTISGDVAQPGKYEVVSELGIRDALTVAGGALQTADLTQVTIARGGDVTRVNLVQLQASVDPKDDILLKDGDVINVPSKIVGQFTILGAVKNVGTYPLLRGTKLLDAVKIAGGTLENNKDLKIRIVRADGSNESADLNALLFRGAIEENKEVFPGDTIVLDSGQSGPATFNIVGGVNRPGRYELTQRTTIMEAIAQAGGFTQSAKREDSKLSRRKDDGTLETITVDLKKMVSNPDGPPLYLQDGDLLDIPDRGRPKRDALETLSGVIPLLWLFGIR